MSKKQVVLLTGSEVRHKYFISEFLKDDRFDVELVISESSEKGLLNKVLSNVNSTEHEKMHVLKRLESEKAYLGDYDSVALGNNEKILSIPKGQVNDNAIIEKILAAKPDLLISYGCSIIKGPLLENYKGRFINVHLGLSPYYRGGGTNMWPIINEEPEYIGATFMYIDKGIDTGHVIHQIRAQIHETDTVHDVGNRLIIEMTKSYRGLVAAFELLTLEKQIESSGKLYLAKDFTPEVCELLYKKIADGVFKPKLGKELPKIVENKGFMEYLCK